MDFMADHEQRLVRHHHFVIFDVVADQHQYRFLGHGASGRIVSEEAKMPKCGDAASQRPMWASGWRLDTILNRKNVAR
jgi:hypothetical protein